MNYKNMSDFEINKAVAESRPFTQVVGDGLYPSVSEDAVHVITKTFKYGNEVEGAFDPCNNPSDAWPIIIDNSIQFNYDSCQVHCDSYFSPEAGTFSTSRKFALRAAMIAYLMMGENQ